jgi:acetyl esterase
MNTDTAPLEPELAENDRLMAASGVPQAFSLPPGEAQRRHAVSTRIRFHAQIPLPVHSITDVVIPRDPEPIAARVIRPHDCAASAPTVVYFHGGGWALGDLDSHEGHARRIARRVGAVVVTVDYRLAPEHPFPAAYDDAVEALQWAVTHVSELGGDPDRIVIAGDSAGGNLALAAAVTAAERGIDLAGQFLVYPATDFALFADDGAMSLYLGDRREDLVSDPRVSPAKSPHLADVAPIVIGLAGHDFLDRDNAAFVEKLEELGVSHTARRYPSLPHGFFSAVSISPVAERAADELCADLRALLWGDDSDQASPRDLG